MNDLRTLILLSLRSLYGINRFLYTKDKREKNRYKAFLALFTFLGVMIAVYVIATVYLLCELGLSDYVPFMLILLAGVVSFGYDAFSAGARLFGHEGYDILAAMPLKTEHIVIGRFMSMYCDDLLITVGIMLPGMLGFGIFGAPPFVFYPLSLLAILFIPLLPLVGATLLGTLLSGIMARVKHKSLIGTALSVGLVVALLIGSFSASELDTDRLLSVLSNVGELMFGIYPPAVWLGDAMLGKNMLGGLCFLLLSLGLFALCMYVTTKLFHRIVRGLASVHTGRAFKLKKLSRGSMPLALYKRELRRYFSSTVYVTNTIIGPIMGCILAGAIAFGGLAGVEGSLPDSFPLRRLVPFVLSGVFCMMTTTSTSISMEGRRIDLIRSLPIDMKAWLDAKLLLNLSLMLPFYLLSEIFLMIGMRPTPLEALWLWLLPAAIACLACVLGLSVNLKWHRFDWEREEQVVKQSASAAIGGFGGLFVSLLLTGVALLIPPAYADVGTAGILLLLIAATLLLYRANLGAKPESL